MTTEGRAPTGVDAVVVVPTYNEARTIGRLLDELFGTLPDIHVLVVDDNSPDGTAARVRSRAEFGSGLFMIQRPGKGGLGSAYRAGFAWALEHGYGSIVQMDADLSHPVARVPRLLATLDDADIAVGSRYVPGGRVENWAWHRRAISRVGNVYVAMLLALGIRDATAGFKAFRREALEAIDVLGSDSQGYSFQIENAWRARRLGLQIVEVPITFTERAAGESKMSTRIVAEALTRVGLWRARELWQEHREIPLFLAVGGAGYVTDVVAFNLLLGSMSSTVARLWAVVPAMVVTYLGNRHLTWRQEEHSARRREVVLFVVFNAVGLGFSVACLWVSHDLLGLTSRLADNISANVIGLAAGTAFRFVTYRRFVFATGGQDAAGEAPGARVPADNPV